MLLTIDELTQKLELGVLPYEYKIKTPFLINTDELTHILSLFKKGDHMLEFVRKISLEPDISITVSGRTIKLGTIARLQHVFVRGGYFVDKLEDHKQELIFSYFQRAELDKDQLIYLLQNLAMRDVRDELLYLFNFSNKDLLGIANDFNLLLTLSYDVIKLLYHYFNPVRRWRSSDTPLLDMYYFANRVGHILGLSNNIKSLVMGEAREFNTEYAMSAVSLKLLVDCLDSYRHRFPWEVIDTIYYAMKESAQLMTFYDNYYSEDAADILLGKYQNNEMIYLSSGWKGHGVALAIYGKYLLYCNRGQGGDPRYGCRIFEIKNIALINLELIKNLTDPNELDQASKFHEILSKIVDLSKHVVRFRSKKQKHDTCTFVNPKSAVEGMMVLLRAGFNANKERLLEVTRQEITRKKYKHFTNDIRNKEIDEIIKNMFYAQDSDLILFYANLTKAIIHEHHGKGRHFIKDEKEILRAVDLYERLPEKVAILVKADASFMGLMRSIKTQYQQIMRAAQGNTTKPACLLINSYNNFSRHKVSVDNKGHIVSVDNRETPRMPFSYRNARKLIAVC